jgi:hypothetical protein
LIIQAPVISLCNKSDLIVTDPYSTEVICSNCCMVISDISQEMNAKSRTGILTSFVMSFGKCKFITISIED